MFNVTMADLQNEKDFIILKNFINNFSISLLTIK